MVLHLIHQTSWPSQSPKESGILIFLAIHSIFSSTSGIARSLRPNFEGLLTTPSSQKCLSFPSQHHLADSQSRPLHSVRRVATALRTASWSQPPPQLGLRPGRAPTPGCLFPPGRAFAPPPALAPAHCGSCLRRPASVGGWEGGQVAQLPRWEASREEAGR